MERGDTGQTLCVEPSRLNYEVGSERLGRQRADGHSISAGTPCGWQKTDFDSKSPGYYLGFSYWPVKIHPILAVNKLYKSKGGLPCEASNIA
jgi:hypothetical protein